MKNTEAQLSACRQAAQAYAPNDDRSRLAYHVGALTALVREIHAEVSAPPAAYFATVDGVSVDVTCNVYRDELDVTAVYLRGVDITDMLSDRQREDIEQQMREQLIQCREEDCETC